ncbi:hypothetical protein G6O67_006224 [Ophiocordyceps sinensis]|uniref:ATPase synthesis protein 25 n=1 Tax=Ophiocordyceps sinensis TaxID=72228 RepID=A0A8H4LWA6_9HYPO|nr:hypothetical protein G6O67_006224 [Ophiocordyceps sinensis]
MSLRPAVAALACYGCRSAVLRAVLGSTWTGVRGLGVQRLQHLAGPTRNFSISQRRLDSTPRSADDFSPAPALQEEMGDQDGDGAEKHWFLEVEPPRHPPSPHVPALPTVPSDAPSLLEPMIKYVYQDMGLDDLALLDLRDLDPPAALGRNLMMLFATARSERHLHISSGRFVRWLRRNYKVNAKADGLIGPGELKTKLRRLRKRAKLMGTNTMIVPGGDNGLSTGWVCVNFSTGEGELGETASFDAGGRYSGFGAAQTGTTVVIQCMTESRRAELDLETLWRVVLKRGLERGKKVKGEATNDKEELEALVSSKIQLTPGSPASQWQALRQASQQQRYFSTLARRLQAQTEAHTDHAGETQAGVEAATMETGAAKDGFVELRREVDALHARASSLSQERFEALVTSALQIESPAPASERLALVDELLLTGQERGLAIESGDMLMNMIESVVTSPAYDADMARAQRNLELLFAEKRCAMQESQVMRLMCAYAWRGNWDRFWDTFRSPPRFLARRSAAVYELAFRLLADSRDVKMCREAVSWMYMDMRREEPPVLPVGELYRSLRACVLVADPGAEEMIYNQPFQDSTAVRETRSIQRNEFVRVLKDAERQRAALDMASRSQAWAKALPREQPRQPAPPREQPREQPLEMDAAASLHSALLAGRRSS